MSRLTPHVLCSPSHTSPHKMGTSTSRSVLRRTTEDQPPPIDLVVSEPEDSQDSSSLVFHSHLQPAQLEKQVSVSVLKL